MNSLISDSAKRQIAVSEDINRHINVINQIANETASGANQTSNDSVALFTLADTLKATVNPSS